MNRGFVDGNKRVAYACLELFLASNGVVVAAENEVIETFVLENLERGAFRKDLLAARLHRHTQ